MRMTSRPLRAWLRPSLCTLVTSGQVASITGSDLSRGLVLDRRRHAVGAEDRDRPGRNVGDLLDEDRALGAQRLDDVLVVDDLVKDVDRRTVEASARSTISMARSTPAQKPRGFASSTRIAGPAEEVGEVNVELPIFFLSITPSRATRRTSRRAT